MFVRRVGTILALASFIGGCVGDSLVEPADMRVGGMDQDWGNTPLIDTFVAPDGLARPDATCAASSISARQTPAAVLIVLDRSSSMTTSGKWGAAQTAIVKAVDKSTFDHLDLGLLAYPSHSVPGPQCIWGWPVMCGVSALPQVAMANSGADKTNGASGPRKAIYAWLTAAKPDTTGTDASPGYAALESGISALQGLSKVDKRILILITDGGFSCASLSSPTRPGYSDGACPDWEYPASVVSLLKAAHEHKTSPVHTLIVGLPGSDSTGKKQGAFDTAPYQMLLALSAYAWAGSPTTSTANCNGKSFTQSGWAPTVPCHFDMTAGTFNADALATAIAGLRGKVLGCTYALPKVDDKNQQIDKTRVNVRLTLDGAAAYTIPRRSSPTDTCLSGNGCWDLDAKENVSILGKACADLGKATQAKVEILVGCKTILK